MLERPTGSHWPACTQGFCSCRAHSGHDDESAGVYEPFRLHISARRRGRFVHTAFAFAASLYSLV